MYRNSYDLSFSDNLQAPHKLLPSLWHAIKCTIKAWWATKVLSATIMQERKELAELPDHILGDIGIDRIEALTESRRSKYDLPQDRLRQASRYQSQGF